jgi:hypothetical protein
MKRMRKCNDEVYQLAKDQALVKTLKNKRFRPFCLCLPGVMFVTRGSKNSLFSVFDFLSNLDCSLSYIQYIKNCWVRLLSNYNIKYICTIYTRLYTCLASIPRFALGEKVTLRLLKLILYRVDVVEWSRALDVRLSDWCCSVSMVWVQIPSREEQKFDSSKI